MASLLDGPMAELRKHTQHFDFNEMPLHTKQSVVVRPSGAGPARSEVARSQLPSGT